MPVIATEKGERPRILYLITNQISSRFLRGQLGYLIAHGYDVTVATNLEGRDGSELFDEGVEVVAIPYEREPHPLADIRALIATIALIRRVRPSLVNASTPKAGLLGTFAAYLCRVPSRVYVVRGLRLETATGWQRRSYHLMERVAMGCATVVLFNSASLRAAAEQRGLLKAKEGRLLGAGSGNGINLERLAHRPLRDAARRELGLESSDHVVGYVGRLRRDKGLPDLVDAFTQLARQRPTLRLLLVGSIEKGDPLDAETTRKIECDARVIVHPWLDDIGPVFSAIDVLAFASYREGMPNAVLEAQACGLPVAGYAATGTIDAVPPDLRRFLVPPGDVDALASAIASLIDSPATAAAAGARAQRWVEQEFRQDAQWRRLEQLYEELLGPKRRLCRHDHASPRAWRRD